MSSPRIVVLGGYGTFGSLISEQLRDDGDLVIAGRNQAVGEKAAESIGAKFVFCDAKDKRSLQNVISGALLVINAAGPFLPHDHSIPQTCIEANCHYLDLADNREYVKEFKQLAKLAKARNVFACTGVSTAPAVTYVLISELKERLSSVHSIKIYLSAGNKNNAGLSTFESILSYVGVPVQIWRDKGWESYPGWGLPEIVKFPSPVGHRFVQLCDVPDLELFPTLFDAEEVIFKAGLELPLFNLALSMLAHAKRVFPPINLTLLARPLVKISRLFKSYGSYAGGVFVQVEESAGNKVTQGFVTSQNGPRIPTAPAILLARKILAKGPADFGAFPCVGFLRLDEIKNYLEPFGIKLVSK